MSEPMTSFEIEDVLSSIRRLVSEDSVALRPKSRPTPLILTPALRVSPPVPKRPVRRQAADAPPRVAPEADAPRAEAAVAPPADAAPEAQDPGDEDFGICDTVEPVAAAIEPEAIPPAASRTADVPAPGIAGGATAEPAIRPEPSLEDRIADLEAAIGESTEEFEPDGSEDQSPHIPRSIFRPAADRSATDPRGPRPDPVVHSFPQRSGADAAFGPEFGPGFGPEFGPAETARHAGAGNQADFADPADIGPAASPAANQLEEALIDEDSLREIVSELVRQELRGELGERITRSIRRLIRREVNRAMALKELDSEE